MIVKNGHDLFGLGILDCAISRESTDEMTWFFACWCKFRKAKICFNNYWVGMLKNGWGLIITLKSDVSHKYLMILADSLNDVCILVMMEWFLVWQPIY